MKCGMGNNWNHGLFCAVLRKVPKNNTFFLPFCMHLILKPDALIDSHHHLQKAAINIENKVISKACLDFIADERLGLDCKEEYQQTKFLKEVK